MTYRFADCRWKLGEAAWGSAQYLAGHVPGAVFVDVETELAAPPSDAGRHPLPAANDFARSMSAAGVDERVFVVAYGTTGGAERLWWLLRHFGHDACAVLDLDAWRGPLTAGEETADKVDFIPHARSDDTIDADTLASELDRRVVVDARVAARWRGEPNAVDRVPGRIPGAFNAPWNEPQPELPDGDVVAYCGSGVTACVVLHTLHLAGRNGRLYPGSWSEWEGRDELPREREYPMAPRSR